MHDRGGGGRPGLHTHPTIGGTGQHCREQAHASAARVGPYETYYQEFVIPRGCDGDVDRLERCGAGHGS
jgi:hypothetical protein